jgi:hypothetical protein
MIVDRYWTVAMYVPDNINGLMGTLRYSTLSILYALCYSTLLYFQKLLGYFQVFQVVENTSADQLYY